MEIIILIAAMVVVGLLVGVLSGVIWKDNRPIGVRGDYIASIVSTVVVGLIDWYVIPAMGFSDVWKYVGVAVEPILVALLVLWIIRRAKR
jgi:uncharacterized membrane protein YeaQ/YmgE (transglycosylase-associated protein family)